MTHDRNRIYTDAVKDVIGNDPVLDQFDIAYEASFYGTSRDDFVTGTMLTSYQSPRLGIVSSTGGAKKTYLTQSLTPRGRAVSKYYASTSEPARSDYGSPEVNFNPSLAYRETPWKNRTSRTAYRILQAYDQDERYYDSCLPDLARCFDANNGSKVWTFSTRRSETSSEEVSGDPEAGSSTELGFSINRWLSPWNNVATSSIGYVVFNGPETDFSNFGFSDDPTVNREWTWSYPYETKYSPEKRYTTIDDSLGVRSTSLLVQRLGSEIISVTQSLPRGVKGLFPLLPGRHDSRTLVSGSRNAFRAKYSATGLEGERQSFVMNYTDTRGDSRYGFSYIIPCDVKLNRKIDHSGEVSDWDADVFDPDGMGVYVTSEEYLTGTMTAQDAAKVFFGFGDLNNMTHSRYNFLSGNTSVGTIYNGNYSGSGYNIVGTPLSLPSYSSSVGHVFTNWASSPDGSNTNDYTRRTWKTAKATDKFMDDTNFFGDGGSPSSPIYYGAISASYAAGTGLPTRGVFWRLNNNNPTWINKTVLLSDTTSSYGGASNKGNLVAASSITSLCHAVLDVTSAFPWSLQYERAVIGYKTHYLMTYFASAPPYRSQDLGWTQLQGGDALSLIELITGSMTSVAAQELEKPAYGVLRKYDSMIDGVGSNQLTLESASGTGYPFDPGEYRIVFAFSLFSGTTYAEYSTLPNVAAINNVRVSLYKDNAFVPDEDGQKIGGNNYPMFSARKIDRRPSPWDLYGPAAYPYNSATGSTYSPVYAGKPLAEQGMEFYKSYHFGLAPQIRGWKYGLYSGLPTHTKAIFRRNRYGQLRDMLEQRQYTKFVTVSSSPLGSAVVTKEGVTQDRTENIGGAATQIRTAPVTVNFVKQRYSKDDRGIGRIYLESVTPENTYSQNLSPEVTSSLPYFDGVARHRQESDILSVSDASNVSLTLTNTNFTLR